ncbi:hypothetical protein ABPG74_011268 [Tetrahymena malaccensis]
MKTAFFQYLNNKIGQYLYGFNDQQLNLGIMQGKFELRQLTLKPIEINKLIKNELNIPFQIKAGLISKISVEYGSILQLSNVKIQVDELMIVLKPSYNSIKSAADYYESDEMMDKLCQNYSKNETALKTCEKSIFKTFNLQKFIGQIQEGLKKIGRNSSKISNNYDFVDEKNKNLKQDDKGIFEKAIEEKLKEMLEKLKISINKIHIRLEDDDISYQNPISIGLLVENVLLLPQKSEILSVINTKVIDLNADQIHQNRESIKWLKFLQITNLTVYLKNKSEQAIPDSLLREVAYQNMGILEAIKFDDLRNFLIKQFFQSSDDLHIFKIIKINLIKCNYIHTTSPRIQNNSHITTNVQLNSVNMLSSQSHVQFINSQIANMQNNYLIQMSITQPEVTINKEYFITLKEITEFFKNQTYWPYLQSFKPRLRPIVQQYNSNITEVQKKVNQQIIRDWFRVVIWKHRLQKTQQEQYPDVYKKYQLTSVLYSLENPQLINQKLSMANQQQMLTIFNEILQKELNEEIEIFQNMKEVEKRSLQLLEELKESSFTFIFKINKFELYFIEKNKRFFTFFFNLLYCEFSNKFNDYIFFFDLSPICVYLHGGEKVPKANSDKKVNKDNQQESLFVGVAPFQPRSIYDKKLANDKNNYSTQYQQADLAQKKQSSRKIFDNNNNNNYNNNKQQIFTSLDGMPSIPASSSLQNSQHFFSQQATRRSNNNEFVQFDVFSEQYGKQAKNQDIDEFAIKEDSKYSNSQYNNSSMHSSSSPKSKKRKQIFEQDFEIQEEFFESKSYKENKEKQKVDLNQMIMKANDRRDLIDTKTNFIIKFQTNNSKNQVNLNIQLPEIHINQDTRDLKEILSYFKEFPLRPFLNSIAECFSKRDYQKVTSIIKKANFLKYKNGQYKINSSLQIQSLLRPLANSKNLAKQGEKQPKINQNENYDIEKNQKDGLYLFEDDDDDLIYINPNQNDNTNTKQYFTNIHSQNTDQDYIDLEDIKNLPNFPKEYQSLFSDPKNNLPSRLEAIQEDPMEMIQTTYKSNTKQLNLQKEDGDLSKMLIGRESKLNTRLSLLRSKIQLYQIFNYYLYKKIVGQKRKKMNQKEKKTQFLDLLDEYIDTKQFNVCVSIGQINIDAKDHFSSDENENIISIQIPPGQIIINFNSNLTNKHTVSFYHFKMSTTSKFKAIKYMINRIKKMVDLSEMFQKEEEEDYEIDF